MLADENIHPQVIEHLRLQGCDIQDVLSAALSATSDDVILREGLRAQRFILTHDRDFGRLAVLGRQPLHGIVFLRPGHIDAQFTMATLQTIDAQDFDFSPSFILVARRRGMHVQLRMRRW